jgi:hypothetical protein
MGLERGAQQAAAGAGRPQRKEALNNFFEAMKIEKNRGVVCFYTWDVAAGVAGCACGFIEKKAIARISVAIHMRIRPTAIIVSTAPINISSPVVPNKPTPVFVDRSPSDFLRKIAVMMTKTKSTTKANNM